MRYDALWCITTFGYRPYYYSQTKRSNDTTQCLNTRDSDTLVKRASPTLSFNNSQWMWTSELANGIIPDGSRGFRKTFVPPQGKTPAFLTLAYAVDNVYTLFVNGWQETFWIPGPDL
ncbi:hypothetical protein C8R42DRAFT_730067 [Lentinula raphanica]|nr:hypothetical protein C8R42DRAFT_730067 [Lentinula raphanica]